MTFLLFFLRAVKLVSHFLLGLYKGCILGFFRVLWVCCRLSGIVSCLYAESFDSKGVSIRVPHSLKFPFQI